MKLFKDIIQFNAAKLQKGNGSGVGLWSKYSTIPYLLHVFLIILVSTPSVLNTLLEV